MERQSLYLAPYRASDWNGSGGGVAGEHEGIVPVERPLAELAKEAERGLIEDGKLLSLVMALRLRQPSLFDDRLQGAGTHSAQLGSSISWR
jgi:hypothetical protein